MSEHLKSLKILCLHLTPGLGILNVKCLGIAKKIVCFTKSPSLLSSPLPMVAKWLHSIVLHYQWQVWAKSYDNVILVYM